jgi:hypothetical protein
MNKIVMAFLTLVALTVNAQTIAPRGFDSPATTTAAPATTTVAPQPAVPATTTAPPVTDKATPPSDATKKVAPHPAVPAPDLKEYAKKNDLPNLGNYALKSDIPSTRFISLYMGLLTILIIVLFIMFLNRRIPLTQDQTQGMINTSLKSELDARFADLQTKLAEKDIKVELVKPNTSVPKDSTGIVHSAVAIALVLIGIGGTTHQAKAECKVQSVGHSIVVKEQAPADISVKLSGCDSKTATGIVAAASGVKFTDVKSSGSTVTAKVAADASAQTGPALIKVTFSDGTNVVSSGSAFALILDPATAMIRKDVLASATGVQAQVRKLERKLDAGLATRPTKDEVASQVSAQVSAQVAQATQPLQQQIARLEQQVANANSAISTANAKISALGQVAIVLAKNDEALANSRVSRRFWGTKPLNPEVAAAAAQIVAAFEKANPTATTASR